MHLGSEEEGYLYFKISISKLLIELEVKIQMLIL
jgi:hypothetical protein